MGKVYGNVVTLDITDATEDSIKDIDEFRNVVTVLYSEKTKDLLHKLNIGNMVGAYEVAEDYIQINGNYFIDKNYFSGLKKPVFLLINGNVIVSSDVTSDDIEGGLTGMVINGNILCTKSIAGTFQSKARNMNGDLKLYEDGFTLYKGDLDINDVFLKSLKSDSKIAVTGTVKLIKDIDKNLFNDKIGSIQLLDKGIVKEEYFGTLSDKLLSGGNDIEVIPSSFEYVDKGLNLNKSNIKKYSHAKLYVKGGIKFAPDVTADELKDAVQSLIAQDAIICKKDIYEYLVSIVQNGAEILTYENEPLYVDGDYRMTAQELNYRENKVTPFVYGLLNIDPDISEDILADKIDAIYNFGQITCSKEIYGLVKFKTKVDKGNVSEIAEEKKEEEPDEDENKHLYNAVQLKL